jgi:AraC-like DNA-binding protein
VILLDQAGAGRHTAFLVPPPPRARPLVEHAFVQRPPAAASPGLWRLVPEANATLVLAVSPNAPTGQRIRCALVGPRSTFADIAMAGRTVTCGLRLHVGALPALTDRPASDFTDRSVPASEALRPSAMALLQRLEDTFSEAAAVAALFAFIIHAARERRPLHDAEIFRGCRTVTELADRLGLSARTSYARLKAETGLSPKRLLRLYRMERTLLAADTTTWSRAAAIGGFADQAHFIRESHALLGESPHAWRARRGLPICSIQG